MTCFCVGLYLQRITYSHLLVISVYICWQVDEYVWWPTSADLRPGTPHRHPQPHHTTFLGGDTVPSARAADDCHVTRCQQWTPAFCAVLVGYWIE